MIKCPNCGSTAQVKFVNREEKKDYEWIDSYKCDCGCQIVQRIQVRERIAYYKGTRIGYEYHK